LSVCAALTASLAGGECDDDAQSVDAESGKAKIGSGCWYLCGLKTVKKIPPSFATIKKRSGFAELAALAGDGQKKERILPNRVFNCLWLVRCESGSSSVV
jgi:hypothetical protein